MKQFFIVFILLSAIFSATAAELNCLCFEDTVTHSESGSIEKSEHHADADADHTDHCHHICTQCHFAALIPKSLHVKPDVYLGFISFLNRRTELRKFATSLYRPPIC